MLIRQLRSFVWFVGILSVLAVPLSGCAGTAKSPAAIAKALREPDLPSPLTVVVRARGEVVVEHARVDGDTLRGFMKTPVAYPVQTPVPGAIAIADIESIEKPYSTGTGILILVGVVAVGLLIYLGAELAEPWGY